VLQVHTCNWDASLESGVLTHITIDADIGIWVGGWVWVWLWVLQVHTCNWDGSLESGVLTHIAVIADMEAHDDGKGGGQRQSGGASVRRLHGLDGVCVCVCVCVCMCVCKYTCVRRMKTAEK